MSEENPLRAEKRKKLHALKEKGLNVFPYRFDRTANAAKILADYEGLETGEKKEDAIFKVAGRIVAFRLMGKAAFFNILDQSGKLQIYIRGEELPAEAKIQLDLIDIGDIVGVTGFVFRTQKGELSLHAKDFQILTKTIEPLPEKWHGLQDIEIKYRHRHLDLISDEESRKVFQVRSQIMSETRKWLDARGFMEVETPMLQPIYGGAAAHPFSTQHRALDMKLFLKISPELYLKRLIVGGFDKVYDMNKCFRNEGIDRTHNPEFTMLEWYEAYTDYTDQQKNFEDLICHLVKTIKGSLKIQFQGKEIDFTTPWRRLPVYDGLREYAKIEPDTISDADLLAKVHSLGSKKTDGKNRGELMMELFELTAEEHLWNPTFVMDHPIEISPLTKVHRKDPRLVERFEPFIACMEVGNSYSELNDPEEQRARLKEQEANRGKNEEAHPMDEDFLHAIETGMPPTGGVGIGMERIVMLLTDRPSIRDIIFFPTMKFK